VGKNCSCARGDTTHTQHMNTSYPRNISINNFICILYINMCYESHTENLVFYKCTFAWLSL